MSLKKILVIEIICVEVYQRDHIFRGSDQLFNSCKKSGDIFVKVHQRIIRYKKKMILVKGHI